MENTDSSFQDKENSLISYIRCTYDIKDTNETQIMNYRSETYVNDEIEKKVKILRDGNKEKLTFKKKFDKLGLNTVEFIIEGKLTSISYLFYKCSEDFWHFIRHSPSFGYFTQLFKTITT